MPTRELRKQDVEALEVMEGKVTYVYDDAKWPTRKYKQGDKVAGTLTAGVGHTGSDLVKWIGKTIPDTQIDAWLDADNDNAENAVIKLVKVPLNDNQFAALVFFVFNVGVDAFRKSTLLRKLNKGDYDAVPTELSKWTKTTINGVKVPSNGLVKRRAEETTYWLADNDNPPKPVSRPAGKPTGTQVGEKEAPKTVTLENAAAAGGIVSTVFSSVTEGPLAYAVAGIAVLAFGIFAYWFVTKRLFPR